MSAVARQISFWNFKIPSEIRKLITPLNSKIEVVLDILEHLNRTELRFYALETARQISLWTQYSKENWNFRQKIAKKPPI